MHKDYLIIGSGVAAVYLANELELAGKSYSLYGMPKPNDASRVAAGMFSPLSGKRMTLAWKAKEMFEAMFEATAQLEKKLEASLLLKMPVQVAFGQVKEANDFSLMPQSDTINEFVGGIIKGEDYLHAPYGAFETKVSGWLNMELLLERFFSMPNRTVYNEVKMDRVNYADITSNPKGWLFKENTYNKVIFAEGIGSLENPWIGSIPIFKLSKGQVLIIDCPELPEEKIVKKGVYLVPLGDGKFKAGATYEWNFENDLPNAHGLDTLSEKIQQLIKLPFTVVKQMAGVRPTTTDRNPVIGPLEAFNPNAKGLFIINGLGTKGAIRAAWAAKQLINYTEKEIPLLKEINIERYKGR